MATILVVEDDGETAAFIALVLKDAVYRVLHVADGQAALRVLGSIRPQLVLADIYMPGMDGRTLCHTLTTAPQHAALPRVLMSGVWDDLTAPPDVVGVLHKPLLPSVLLDRCTTRCTPRRPMPCCPARGVRYWVGSSVISMPWLPTPRAAPIKELAAARAARAAAGWVHGGAGGFVRGAARRSRGPITRLLPPPSPPAAPRKGQPAQRGAQILPEVHP